MLRPQHPARVRIGVAYGALFQTVGTSLLSATVNGLCDIVKTKEDMALVNTRLYADMCGAPAHTHRAAIDALGSLALALQNMVNTPPIAIVLPAYVISV